MRFKPVVARSRPSWKGRIWTLNEIGCAGDHKNKLCKGRRIICLINQNSRGPRCLRKPSRKHRGQELLHWSVSSTVFLTDQELMLGVFDRRAPQWLNNINEKTNHFSHKLLFSKSILPRSESMRPGIPHGKRNSFQQATWCTVGACSSDLGPSKVCSSGRDWLSLGICQKSEPSMDEPHIP